MRVDSVSFNHERKNNTYYSNKKKRDQQQDFQETLMSAIRNVNVSRRLYV